MYFLDKLCRICVRSGVALVDIDTVDFDSVTLNEKLQICANLVKKCEELIIYNLDCIDFLAGNFRRSHFGFDMRKMRQQVEGVLPLLGHVPKEYDHHSGIFREASRS